VPPSPNTLDYCPSILDDTDESTSDLDSSDNRGRVNKARVSVVALQHLYSVFLPPHLWLNEDIPEKHRRTKNRCAEYTKDSQTTLWRRDVEQTKAAQGCATLDGFVVRKVGSPKDIKSNASHCKRRDSTAPHHLRKIQKWKFWTLTGTASTSWHRDLGIHQEKPPVLARDNCQ